VELGTESSFPPEHADITNLLLRQRLHGRLSAAEKRAWFGGPLPRLDDAEDNRNLLGDHGSSA